MTVAPALAQTGTSTATSTPPMNLPCIQAAVQKHGNALIAAEEAFWSARKGATQTRLSAIVAAWGIADPVARRTAIKQANRAYRDALKQAQEAKRNAEKAAADQWKVDRNACGFATSTRGFGGRHGWGPGGKWGGPWSFSDDHGKFGKWWKDRDDD